MAYGDWWMKIRRIKLGLLTGAVALITGCAGATKLLTQGVLGGGSGTNVAANTQIGKENNQVIGAVSNIDASAVESIVVNNTSFWMIIALLSLTVTATAGWLLPQPKWLQKLRKTQ